MTDTTHTTKPDPFLSSYIETALWSSHDTDDHGRELQLNSGEYELAEATLARFKRDCEDFEPKAVVLVNAMDYVSGDFSLAHDFWLTRNGHGAGFWDGDYPEPLGTQLTNLAKSYGECNLSIGDDGKIYC